MLMYAAKGFNRGYQCSKKECRLGSVPLIKIRCREGTQGILYIYIYELYIYI